MMNFKDGPKEVAEGDTFFSMSNQYNSTTGHTVTIKSIGRVYVTDGFGDKWHIDTGSIKSEYTGYSAYSSEAAFMVIIENSKYHDALREMLSTVRGLTKEQCLKMADVLGFTDQLHILVDNKKGRKL